MALAEAFTFEGVVLVRDGRRILDGVSDHVHRGETTAVVGPSGSGKSTFLRLLNRFEDPTEGVILLDGQPLSSYEVHALRRRVGLVAQRPTMLAETIVQEVRVGRPDLEDAAVVRLLERVALPDVRLGDPTSTLSGGEQQRVALARTLALDPEVLLLDEPTSSLDDISAQAVDRIIRSLVDDGLTAVLVSHDLSRVVHVADSVLVLHQGRLVERGRPGEVRYLS
ncbi:MAG: ATP-binding cassette domain-containing protein [Candidatus Nanopelagicales bacterium]